MHGLRQCPQQHLLQVAGFFLILSMLFSLHRTSPFTTEASPIPTRLIAPDATFLSPFISMRNSTVCVSGLNNYAQMPFVSPEHNAEVIQSQMYCEHTASIYKHIYTSSFNSFILDIWGQLHVSGDCYFGQCGLGVWGVEAPATMRQVPLSARVREVCAMDQTTAIWTEQDDILTTGRNQFGQTGLGFETGPDGKELKITSFQKVYMERYLTGVTIMGIYCGQQSMYVLADKKIFSWGRNDMYQLGDGTQWNRYVPQQMSFFSDASIDMLEMSVGEHEAYALDSSGLLWAWGRGYSGQMGYFSEMGWADHNQVLPVRVSQSEGKQILSVAAGDEYLLILTTDGTIKSVGSNLYGQLAFGALGGNSISFEYVNTTYIPELIFNVYSGLQSIFLITNAGGVYGAGRGSYGIFGNPDLVDRPFAELVNLSHPIRKLSAANHMITLKGELCDQFVEGNPHTCNGHGYCGYIDGHSYCACEAGYSNQLALLNVSCVICPAGQYSVSQDDSNSITVCVKCPVNSYSTHSGASSPDSCKSCPVGYITAQEGSDDPNDCAPCDPGNYAFIGEREATCAPCPPGTWNDLYGSIGLESCTNCTAGTFQSQEGQTSNATCIPCSAGLWSDTSGASSNITCVPCPVGTYSSQLGQDSIEECILCPIATFNDVEGSTECDICPPFLVTRASGASKFTDCEFCPAGFYSNFSVETGLSACAPCPSGTYANQTDATSSDVCLRCPSGHVTSDEGNFNISSCQVCPPTTFAKSGYSSCSPCPSGTYSTSGSSVCISCPPGKVLQVPLDEVTDDLDANCGLCHAGTWTQILEGGVTICVPCKAGTYSTIVGALNDTVCQRCHSGTYSELEGRNSSSWCEPCPRGTWSNAQGANSFGTCVPCAPGYYSNVSAAVSPMTCRACPSGTWNSLYGSASIDACILCPSGTSSPLTGRNASSTCEFCPPQTYAAAASPDCSPCPLGHYTDPNINGGRGMQSIDDCIPCPSGTYFKTGNDSAFCVKCPKGTYSTTIGAFSPTTCVNCEPGSFNDIEGSDSCEYCVRGTWSAIIASDSSQKCESCPRGYFSNVTGASTPDSCQPCPSGSYQEISGSYTCSLCPAGTYSTLSASQNQTNCIECGAGYFQPSRGASSQDSCIPCPGGTYSTLRGMIAQQNCTLCAQGRFSPVIAANSEITCKDCPADTYADELGSIQCKQCPDGHLTSCENVVDSEECLSDDDRLDSISVCRPCAPGSYLTMVNGIRMCTRCQQGTYSETVGAVSNDTCINCPAGTFTSVIVFPQGGSSSLDDCSLCPAGTYNPLEGSAGSFQCLTCPPATWSPPGSPVCRLCPAGTASSSTGADGFETCGTCPPGTWSGEGFTSCISCEEGYYSTNSGATNISSCISCPIGTASSVVGSSTESNCKACQLGFYTSDRASPRCLSCPAGSFSNETGSTSCMTCPEGTFSLQSSFKCIPCNVGTYSEVTGAPSRSSCKICPLGTYNPVEGASRCIPCGSENICPEGASSLLPNLIFLRQEDQKILSPIPLTDDSVNFWLKWGTVILIAFASAVAFFLIVVCSCCSDYTEWFSLFRQSDILYNMSHENRLGTANDKSKTRMGGLCSMLVLPASLIILTIIIADAFAFNVNLMYTFKLLESASSDVETDDQVLTNDPSYGNYLASISVMGHFPKCEVIPREFSDSQAGFWIEAANIQPEVSLEDSQLETVCKLRDVWLGEQVTHCYCEVRCTKCTLMGISQTVSFGVPREFATRVGYELVVPYYSRSSEDSSMREPFLLNGTVVAEEGHIFYGVDPVNLFISVFETQYISTPNFIFKALGRSGTKRRGLTSQLLTVSSGDNPTVDEQREALKDDNTSGFHITFSIARSNLAFVQEEILLQDFIAILASISALVGAVFEVARLIMTQYEKREMNYQDFQVHFQKFKIWAKAKYKAFREPKIEKIPRNTFKEDQNPWDMKDMEHPIEPPEEEMEETISEVDDDTLSAPENSFNLIQDPWTIAEELKRSEGSNKGEPSLPESVSDDRLEMLAQSVSPEMLAYMTGGVDGSLERMKHAALDKERRKRNMTAEEDQNDDEDDLNPQQRIHSPRTFMHGSKTKVVERQAHEFSYKLPDSPSNPVSTLTPIPTSLIFEGSMRGGFTVPVSVSSPLALGMDSSTRSSHLRDFEDEHNSDDTSGDDEESSNSNNDESSYGDEETQSADDGDDW
uniref:TNFR-Cys domain-containing protein n=1 Tax=Percolomonas cosmopolitus TaxID=63605 RepID=A0A7S1PH81_9EUKA|mmetsp:Transcript_4888/g.18337  ORF Transcript_4888/g.18337 Transcript_4888/m.18337 type:complete len:2193 (+) Transcript_4888:613-7191(+)|eukprot:CAMPEP_0117441752 /NCGR_PEP_ID=MMETSP0759-20121206/3795_1 /TAXON_ID=63605 /ORGANISM="Percolomonas cosmopolitus, Strain WS" /LENGTH=2192 /DNA_ID=CAMNT_0005233613 /DNA_START=543 /DNA_END=7118 /DNA_ORIENTATION=-